MADIAFLLLIFFLVTTTIASDEGINRKLPRECPTGQPCSEDLYERNVLRIVLNAKDEIMVENDIIDINNLKTTIKDFIDNNGDQSCLYCNGKQLENASDNPQKAVISLVSDRKTSYALFINVQDEITKAYHELRLIYGKTWFNISNEQFTKAQIKVLREAYPFIISEAETR